MSRLFDARLQSCANDLERIAAAAQANGLKVEMTSQGVGRVTLRVSVPPDPSRTGRVGRLFSPLRYFIGWLVADPKIIGHAPRKIYVGRPTREDCFRPRV